MPDTYIQIKPVGISKLNAARRYVTANKRSQKRTVHPSRFYAFMCILALLLMFYPFINQQSSTTIIKLQNDSVSNRAKLCVAVYGTTLSEKYTIETIELLNIYKNRNDVYFFLEDFGDTLDYKLCDILSDPNRCIWLKPKIQKKMFAEMDEEQRKEWREDEFIDVHRTRTVFAEISRMRLYDQCEYIMKLDSDAYVDMDRFGDWLSYNFDSSDDLYVGMIMGCHGWQMAQGIYTVSSGVFTKRPNLTFDEVTIHDHTEEDCSFGYLMTEMLHIPIVDDVDYLIYSRDQMENKEQWEGLSYFEKQCHFSCHKCTGEFRESFVRQTSYMPLHVDHCRYKGYRLGYINHSMTTENGTGSGHIYQHWNFGEDEPEWSSIEIY